MKLYKVALTVVAFALLSTQVLFAQRTTGGGGGFPGGNTGGGNVGGTSRMPTNPSLPSIGNSSQNSQVTIEVRLDGRDPIDSPVMVDLLLMGAPVAHSHTDSSGRVTFNNLGAGSYTANISGADIQATSVNFTVDYMGIQTVMASVQRDDTAEERVPAGLVDASELSAPKKAHKEYEKGMHEYTAEHFDKAEQHFRNAVTEYPNYSSAWNNIGSIRMRSKDTTGAEQCFRRALQANPNNNYAARNLARLLLENKNSKEAEQIMKHAITLEPTNAESLTVLAYAELQNGEFDDAIATARRVHTAPIHGGSLSHLIAARALEAKQQNSAAILEYQMFLKESPHSPQAKIAQDGLARLGGNQQASR